MVAVGDLLGKAQKSHRDAQLLFGMPDGIASQYRMGLHRLELFRREAPRLEQYVIGYADLADVMQRSRLEQQADALVIEKMLEPRMFAKHLGQ
ncbi:hypothetical protein D3C87_1953300 [compost metagenome]